ncbi:TetR/AcrR family transcriptional regulator [Streptomyces sp. NPDC051954]|uniref:TetR/AcrR family transcriptional regulator n=1 Tax=unclassified Streptomyces TaxID=2593676 RepID=UPI00342E49F1
MGTTKQQVAENRQAIVTAADALFRLRGVDAVGLNELMGAAGLTRGGFYNHFTSKDTLVDTVVANAVADGIAALDRAIATARASGGDPLTQRISWYMSPEHRADIVRGCPVAGFAGDARRLGPAARGRYAEGLAATLDRLTATVRTPGLDEGEQRARAIALFSEMVGAVVLSRAVTDVDPALADEILEGTLADLYSRTDATP